MIGFFALAGVALAADALKPAAPTQPVPLIFATDIGNDCDDAMALAVIRALQKRQACRLLAVTLTNPDPLAGRLVDAINTFYGRGDIPIGVNPQAPEVAKVSRYLKTAPDYSHDFDPARAPTALALLRRTLAAAEDRSVGRALGSRAGIVYEPRESAAGSSGRQIAPIATAKNAAPASIPFKFGPARTVVRSVRLAVSCPPVLSGN